MAQSMFNTKHVIAKQSKSSLNERQRASTMNPTLSSSTTTTDNGLSTEHKHRSTSFSNAIHQVVGFVQRKLSSTNAQEKQQLSDLGEVK